MGNKRSLSAPMDVLEDGRVTIPKPIREEFGIEPGNRVIITVEPLNGGNDE